MDLLLLRHAKAVREAPDGDDHGRGLAPRGVEAARRMGRLLVERGLWPDRVLCSTARRTVATWELVAEAKAEPTAPELRADLYEAAAPQLLAVLRGQPAAGRLLLVGHNNGLHELARSLAGAGEPALLQELAADFPTAALAWLRLDALAWRDLGTGRCTLVDYWRPRALDG